MSDVYRTQIQDHGRVLIPAAVRRSLGLHQGDEVVLRVSGGAVVISGIGDAVKQFQAAVRDRVPTGTSLAADLIAERRATAADE